MNTELNPEPWGKPDVDDAAVGSELVKDLAAQKDLYLRLAADFDNFRRRSRQEVENRVGAQKESLIVELLPVIDNLERALVSDTSHDSMKLHQGVEMTLKLLQQLLRQHGVQSDEIVGQPFNPHLHDALSHGRDPFQADQAILTVIQRGYRRGEKVLRPAKVVVNDLTVTKQSDGRLI